LVNLYEIRTLLNKLYPVKTVIVNNVFKRAMADDCMQTRFKPRFLRSIEPEKWHPTATYYMEWYRILLGNHKNFCTQLFITV